MEQINYIKILFLVLVLSKTASAQEDVDSIRTKRLDEITIEGDKLFTIERLPKIKGTYIWTGKKNEVINVQNLDANIAEKTPRQIFSKVPGVFVYDMDGTGNQTNISTRGLDPHRGWEYNIRKNNIITNSDMYGYPASHYSMPMEAVDHIELVRGTGSLQYGAQFGGMLNYVSKKPDTTKAFNIESINSVGSFNTLSTYNAVSGSINKVRYYAYYNKRVSDGYRENSHTDFDAQSLMVIYSPSKNLELTAEVARSNYVYQLPGPLTDSMFYADPRQSTRSRNYFNPEIFVPSFTLDWKINEQTRLSWVVSAVLGSRNSVQFDKQATTNDVIDPVTLQYASRQVDVDHFNSYTSELRLLHQYAIGKIQSALSTGIQVIDNDLNRQQLGKGSTGSDFDLSTDGVWGRDLHFKTKNVALFAENSFWLTPVFVVTPGMRFELGRSEMTGFINYYDPGELPNNINHRFPLFGMNAEYTSPGGNSIYAGWSQAYRPVLFKDIIPASTYEIADKNLKDADGYNLEVGYRGMVSALRWDISAFSLRYNNRPGSLVGEATNDGSFYILRTNVGNSKTNGIEAFAEYALLRHENAGITVFTSTALFDSQYSDAQVRSGNQNLNISGNKIESVPAIITRNGITFRYHDLSLSCLYSYTGESYADPLNTVKPSATGAVGIVPSYGLLDINASLRIYSNLLVRINLNNVTDKQYFTKRPQFYPGPGVWSSDGISVNCSVAYKI